MAQSAAPPLDDQRITDYVNAAKLGDKEAFGELYRLMYERIFSYIFRRVATRAVAEDLASETFIRALRRIETFNWTGHSFEAWIVTIARNLIADNFKSSYHRRERSTADMLDGDQLADSPEEIVLDGLTNKALQAAFTQASAHLTQQQRVCITLRFVRGMSVAETAALMGKSEGAVKTLQYRAVGTLGRELRIPD